MAYKIELGIDPDEGLYLEVAIRNINSGGLMSGAGVDFRLNVFGFARDYGCGGIFGATVASTSNGMIVEAAPGVQCINVPMCALLSGGVPVPPPPGPPLPPPAAPGSGPLAPDQGAPVPPPYAPFFEFDLRRSLRAKLLAVPLANPAFAKVLATLVISIGGTMPPRLTLDAYPLYPNSVTANTAACEVQQIKQQLAQLGQYDAVEAAITGGPTDPVTIAWNTGGMMSFGGPLSNKIASVLGYAPSDMALLINNAALATI